MNSLILPSLIFIPLITALVIALVPSAPEELAKSDNSTFGDAKPHESKASGFSLAPSAILALAGASLTGLVAFYVLFRFAAGDGSFQFESSTPWVESIGLSWSFGIDGISLFMVALTGLLFPVALLTTSAHHDAKAYHVWLMLLMAGSMGAFVALDLLLFFLFFEAVLVPMYFLIGGWGHADRVYASMKFFIYTMAASALMLVGIGSLVWLAADGGSPSFDYRVLVETVNAEGFASEHKTAMTFIFFSFALAFSVKVPLFPIHTWLPDAHTEAPTAGSIILAGVLLKLGTYGFLRFGIGLFREQIESFGFVFFTLGVIGIVYGAAVATMQSDLKRLVAYSSVAHMGFIVLGIFALNQQGVEGAVLQMVNHGLSTGALFILVGWIYDRRHTRQIAELGGLQKSAPVLAGVFTFVMLSSIGLPGLNGFVGEYLILLGTFQTGRWWAVVAVTGVILAALYMLWAFQRSFHGPAHGKNAEVEDLRSYELFAILPLLALILFLGIYPRPVLDRIEPSVDALLGTTQEAPENPGADKLVNAAEKAEEAHGKAESHSASMSDSEAEPEGDSGTDPSSVETSEGEARRSTTENKFEKADQ